MTSNELLKLCKELKDKENEKTRNEQDASDYKDIIKSLKDAYIWHDQFIYNVADTSNVGNKLYKFSTEKLVKANTENKIVKANEKDVNIFNNQASADFKLELLTYKGYIEIKKGVVNFKIIDQGKKKSDGSVCRNTSTFTVERLKELIDDEKLTEKKHKLLLCDLYEIILRATIPKCFARIYESQFIKKKKK